MLEVEFNDADDENDHQAEMWKCGIGEAAVPTKEVDSKSTKSVP